MNNLLLTLVLVQLGLHQIRGDIYLHNPRGANNRLNEASRNRQNANRLYNSQNNNRGGYNVGSLFYYGGSKLKIEWTNQHSCGGPNNHCNIVIQYTCGDMMRDGTTTDTIPTDFEQCNDHNCTSDLEYGMHEDIYYYANCRLRSRNKGLFTANQRVGDAATSTRQNARATRYGYECQEERDYYPYWGPTPWRDIAIFTNDPSRCDMFQSESQNVKAKYACDVGNQYLFENVETEEVNYIPITKDECEDFTYTESGKTKKGVWRLYPAHGIDAPDCAKSQPSRDNHLGNTIGGETMSYDWIVPNYFREQCVLRIRYNISTTDYDRDTTGSESNTGRKSGADVYTKYGLNFKDARSRGYRFQNNPILSPFNLNKLKLRLSLNTAQYGRTFQDRSHTFSIRPRPSDIPSSAEILNINVRGKRGNIVQNYPAVEYDFVPNTAVVEENSYVHYQWTGSNNNPANNAGQGRQGSDRSNLVMLKDAVYIEGNPEIYKNNTYGQYGASYPAHIDQTELGGLSRDDLVTLALVDPPQRGGDMDELDDAGTYFDLGPRKMIMPGTYHYMCTRNNNFSNRSQKGKLVVKPASDQ